MRTPALIDCPAGVWTLVAASILTGQLHLKDAEPGSYLQTYRPAGLPVPTESAEGVKIDDPSIPIYSVFEIDVYIMPLGANGVVRLDRTS